jgi:glycosyltransferase involved in cell wall biosynthesis
VNILQLCKYYPPVLGGIELVEKTITKAHMELGDSVTIVAFSHSKGELKGEFLETIYHIKQDLLFKSAPVNFTFFINIKKIIERHKIDRIYVHLPNPYMHEILRATKKYLTKNHVQIIGVYHSDIVNQKFLGKLYNLYFYMSKNFYDLWICSSEKLWLSSAILSKVESRKKRIIPFCTEGALTYKHREKFNGILLAVGRLVPYKGFEFLINTINNTKYQLHIIGDGPEYKKLKEIAGKNIKLHRQISEHEKKALFIESDALIVSSINRAEAYGMIIVEAFESGLPVIASNIDSGVTFLVQHEKTGLVFENKNAEKLIEALKRFEIEQGLYQKISENTNRFYEEELKYEHFKEKIKNI